jgi:hypothetical protein
MAAEGVTTPAGSFESLGRMPRMLQQPVRAAVWFATLLFGTAILWLLLALLASYPVGNLLALGFVLEAEGRVARSGRLRHALFLIPAAARLGSMTVGFAVWLAPLWLLAGAAADARWIARDGSMPRTWRLALATTSLLIGLHLLLAMSRGGSPGCFLRPIRNARWLRAQLAAGTYWPLAQAAVREYLTAWRLPHHLRVGAVGFVATAAWLAVPTALYATLRDSSSSVQRLLTIVGGASLVPVLAWLPVLQARFAADPRVTTMFDLRAARASIRQAPLAWLLGTIALYALSIPLFYYSLHLKMHLPPHRGLFDLMFISLACMFPARVFLGMACHRAACRSAATSPQPAHPRRTRIRTVLVVLSRAVLYVLLAFFVWLLFHTRFATDLHHILLIHHSLLLPIPSAG